MRKYEIWSEGFSATGEYGPAQLMGSSEGNSFEDACRRLAEKESGFDEYYNPERNTYWGCRLFDNEADARRSFG